MRRVATELHDMRRQLLNKHQENTMDARVTELTKQLAWFQREAILQQEERKRLVDKCKHLEIRC
jgi:hypothetical protein